MTVAYKGIGTGANGSTTVAPTCPATVDAGDLLIAIITSGASGNPTPTAPDGTWTSLGTVTCTNGAGYGIDAGVRRVTAFYKVAAGTEDGAAVTFSIASGDTCRGTILSFSKTGASWDVAATTGADSTAGTGVSIVGGALNWSVGDVAVVGAVQLVDNVTASSVSLTATGITFGTRTSRAAVAVTTGSDHRHIIDTWAATTAGSGSQAPTYAYTASASTAVAAAVFIRIDEIGTVYSDSISDSSLSGDTFDAQTTYGVAETESSISADTFDAQAVLPVALSESSQSTDNVSGVVEPGAVPTLYYVIYPAALAAPSAAQIKAGQDATSAAATASGNEAAPTTSGATVFDFAAATGLTANTDYKVAFVWSDGANDSNVAVSGTHTTASDGIPASISEVSLVADTLTVLVTFSDSVAANTISGDQYGVNIAAQVSISDSALAGSTFAAAQTQNASVSETVIAGDTQAATQVQNVAYSESSLAGDTMVGETGLSDSHTPSSLATDFVSANSILGAALSDSAIAGDSFGVQVSMPAALSESALSSEQLAAQQTLSVSYSESVIAAMTVVGETGLMGDLAASSISGDSFSTNSTSNVALSDSALSAMSLQVDQVGAVAESSLAGDTLAVSQAYAVAIAETSLSSDSYGVAQSFAVVHDASAISGQSFAIQTNYVADYGESAISGQSFGLNAVLQDSILASTISGDNFPVGQSVQVSVAASALAGTTFVSEGSTDAAYSDVSVLGATFDVSVVYTADHAPSSVPAASYTSPLTTFADFDTMSALSDGVGCNQILGVLFASSSGADQIVVGETGTEGILTASSKAGATFGVNKVENLAVAALLRADFAASAELLPWRAAPGGGGKQGRREDATRTPAVLQKRPGQGDTTRPEQEPSERL